MHKPMRGAWVAVFDWAISSTPSAFDPDDFEK